MVKKQPKVSIIMGIYNCASTLEEALDSIVNQTYENWELIMCDDCSTDNTVVVASKYVEKYPNKVRLIRNKENITLAPTLNRCLEYVTGEYIARQDGDDISTLNRLEEEVEFLEENKEYDLVATNMISFDENGKKGVVKLKNIPDKLDLIKNGATFSHATILIKTEVMKKLNGYSDKWYAVQAEDYELWCRFFMNEYKGYNLHKDLYYVREDINTYKRKNIKRRLRGIVLRIDVTKRLKAPVHLYSMVLKDIVALFIPRGLFVKYYKWRMNNIINNS